MSWGPQGAHGWAAALESPGGAELMGGFAGGFIPLLIKSYWVINKRVLGRRRFVGPSLLPAGVEGPILLLARAHWLLSILALPLGAESRHP